jgi:hypothetical protein
MTAQGRPTKRGAHVVGARATHDAITESVITVASMAWQAVSLRWLKPRTVFTASFTELQRTSPATRGGPSRSDWAWQRKGRHSPAVASGVVMAAGGKDNG